MHTSDRIWLLVVVVHMTAAETADAVVPASPRRLRSPCGPVAGSWIA